MSGVGFFYIFDEYIVFLQPQNLVMMEELPESSVKLVDFGLSRQIVQGVDLSNIMGTPDYMGRFYFFFQKTFNEFFIPRFSFLL